MKAACSVALAAALTAGMVFVTLPLAAAVPSLAAPVGVPADAGDAAVLHRLRAAIAAADPGWTAGIQGWEGPPAGTDDPCTWHGVVCDEARHVTYIQLRNLEDPSDSAGNTSGPPVQLPPELAWLPRLVELELRRQAGPAWAAIPPAWLAGGACAHLETLVLHGRTLLSPLPDFIQPGALPALRRFNMDFLELRSTLPPGWGADSRVLPLLHDLVICLQVEGGLPPEWASGFHHLTYLSVSVPPSSTQSEPHIHATVPAAASTPVAAEGMPAVWAAGFKNLRNLNFAGVPHLSGALSGALAANGSFPALELLAIEDCGLTGTLPQQLLSAHPLLRDLWLSRNHLTGTLPAAWGSSQLYSLSVHDNLLTGPAFPPAWLEPGALPQLFMYDVLGNAGLTGTLPTALPPKLTQLRWQDSGLTGTVPAAWCNQTIAVYLGKLHRAHASIYPALPACAVEALASRRAFAVTSAAVALVLLVVAGAAGRVTLRQRAQRRMQHSIAAVDDERLLVVSPPHTSSNMGPELARAACGGASTLDAGVALGALAPKAGPLPPRLSQLLDSVCRQAPGSDALQLHVADGQRPGAPKLEPLSRALKFVLRDNQPIILGETKSAAVILGSLHGKPVAVKIQEPPRGVDSLRLWREARLMQRCTHERIVPLLAVGVQDGVVLQVMALMQGGALSKAFESPHTQERLRWRAGGRQVAMDIAEGLHFLHSTAGVQHNDLKSSNVLLTADLRACISDLGVSQLAASAGRSVIGMTLCYAAPEQLLGRCTVAADMFSYGVVLIEIITQTLVTRRGQWQLPRVPDDCSQEVLDLIQECLQSDPERRPTAAAALRRLRADAGGGDARLPGA